jgi:ATP-dependent RNA helicase SUPV3L1/SUV3
VVEEELSDDELADEEFDEVELEAESELEADAELDADAVLDDDADFVAIDEIQLAEDDDRGHVFTDRILHMRGIHETLLLGADTMRSLLKELKLGVETEPRPRFSELRYAGHAKITKLPKRTAIVAFSAEEVYAIAELLRRQKGGAAVVMGALSPRTRNAQVALYQSREVDYIVATDAIGMGLNLDVDRVVFASRTKYDGRRHRALCRDGKCFRNNC